MTTQLDVSEIARYLQTHPEFFEQHAEMLAHIHIPSPHGGKAISITERQIGILRDKARQLEGKMSELIGFGEENDIISEKVHRLCVSLLGERDLTGVVAALYDHLVNHFAVPHVKVKLWGVGNGTSTEFADVTDTLKAQVGAMRHPFCGSIAGQEVSAWFDEHVRSVAQVPLREPGLDGNTHEGACFGVLVFASEDVRRFYPDMGTLYLERIGDMAAAALLRVVA
ncbi:MAG TPA: DUF484 family protein [Rhodocyclaceae bacterium]|jgi:uncharacterized protein YigA (DUF484 family)|nr:DUF484 family protein [Rhodocyclaceae bacterium]